MPRPDPITLFVVFNLVAVPIIGRLAWAAMGGLHAGGSAGAAVVLSMSTAGGILAVNILLARATARHAKPLARRVLIGATAVTFALTIGTGFFSPVNLLLALFGR